MGMAPIKMLQLGESVTEGTVEKWFKHEAISSGEVGLCLWSRS